MHFEGAGVRTCRFNKCVSGTRETPARQPFPRSETPMDGPTQFENFLVGVPWEEPDPGMLQEVRAPLTKNFVTRVSHLEGLDIKSLKFDDAPAGGTLGRNHAMRSVKLFMSSARMSGFIQKAIKMYDQLYGSDDEKEKSEVPAPSTPNGAENYPDKESRIEQALLTLAGKTRKMYEHINLEELMEKHGLDWFFPPEVS